MTEEPSYYAVIPANVRYDSDLQPNAKLLYGEITSLCNKHGYCWASNKYFSDLYGVTNTSISRWISSLVSRGYLSSEITYKKGTREIDKRLLRLEFVPPKEILNTPPPESARPINKKVNTPHNKKGKDNNTLINNTPNSYPNNSDKLLGDQPVLEVVEVPDAEKKDPPVAPAPLKSNHQAMIDIYWEWYKGRNDGIPPNLTPAEAAAMKLLRKYLEQIAKTKLISDGNASPDQELINKKSCEILEYIFANWSRLDAFMQKQIKLANINSNITNIINYLKNGTRTAQEQKGDRVGTINAGFSAIEDHYRQEK